MVKAKIVNRPIGDPDWVGNLKFIFFEGADTVHTKIIPFYENPTIKESQDAKYNTYNPVGRSGNVYAYTGADSRRFNLSFNITLPNIQQIQGNAMHTIAGSTKEDQINEILNIDNTLDTRKYQHLNSPRDFDLFYEDLLRTNDTDSFDILNFEKLRSGTLDPNSTGAKTRHKIISLVMEYVNTLRASVINNQRVPSFGPPIVRLTWGIIYQNIPCICKSYSIDVDGDAGYDDTTLLPRVLKVSMSLEEARNYGEFDRSSEVFKDSLAGWEVIASSKGTVGQGTDPGIYRNMLKEINSGS